MSIAELYRNISPGDIGRTSEIGGGSRPQTTKTPDPKEFQQALFREQQGLSLSQHAETRIKSRDIPWNPAMEKRVQEGIDALEAKGSREALILADGVAFIANVKSRTIVSAMEQDKLKERVFTNIDSAVVV